MQNMLIKRWYAIILGFIFLVCGFIAVSSVLAQEIEPASEVKLEVSDKPQVSLFTIEYLNGTVFASSYRFINGSCIYIDEHFLTVCGSFSIKNETGISDPNLRKLKPRDPESLTKKVIIIPDNLVANE